MNPFYTYEPRSRRYRNKSTGRFIRREEVALLTESHIANIKNDLREVSQLLIDNKINLRTWQTAIAQATKNLHIQEYLLGVGGESAIQKEDYLEIARELKNQYSYLRQFAVDLTQGKMTANQALNRTTMYGDAAKVSFFRGEKTAAKRAGLTYAQRILGNAEHCISCPQIAARGIVPIDEIIMPTTQCECKIKCKCRIQYLPQQQL